MLRSIVTKSAAVFTATSALAAPAAAQMGPYGYHMWDRGWLMPFGLLPGIILIAVLVALVWFLVRWLLPSSARSATGTDSGAMTILRERFARGEISKEEYEERRHILNA